MEEQPALAAPPPPESKQSPRPKRWHPSPDPVDSMNPPAPSGKRSHPGTEHSSLSCTEVFGQDSDLVKEARREFFSKHSYNFTM